jgi:hypothetical protein
LTTRHEISFNDGVIIVVVLVDFLQYLAIGPSFNSISSAITDLSKATSVNLEGLIDMNDGMFWLILNVVYALCFLWFVCGVVVTFRIDLRFESSSICKNFGQIAEVILPILSNS